MAFDPSSALAVDDEPISFDPGSTAPIDEEKKHPGLAGPALAMHIESEMLNKPLVPPEYTPPYLLGQAAAAVLPDSTATKIYTGELKAVGDLISSFTSPMNIMLLGTAGIGKVAQRLIAGAFSAQAAIHSPEAWKEFNATDDPELKTRIAIGTVAGVGLPLLAMRTHGPEKMGSAIDTAVKETIAEQAKKPPFDPASAAEVPIDLPSGAQVVADVNAAAPVDLAATREAPSAVVPPAPELRPDVVRVDPAALTAANEAAAPLIAEDILPTPDEVHTASIDSAMREITQPVEVFGFGPGAASAEEALSLGSQIKQLTDTVSDDLRTPRNLSIEARLNRAINSVGGTMVSARESLGRGVANARATWLAMKDGYFKPPKQSEFIEAVKDWQGADQRTSFEVRQFVHKLRTEIKDPAVRDGLTNYIQADGDVALLQERAAKSNIKYRPGYEAALRLTDAQKTLAANVRQYFDAMLQDGINAGIVDHGLDNYINQVWKRPNKFTQQLQADLQAGKLQTNFQFARKRIFDSFFDGERAGYAPASKDVSALLAAYDLAFNRSLAARGFVKSLREAKAADGEPVVKFSGMTQPIVKGEGTPEAYLIRSKSIPENAVTKDGRKYEIVDHPALRGWKMVIQGDSGAPAYYQTDMLVHPDHAGGVFRGGLRNILGRSKFRNAPVLGQMLKAGALAKQTKLSLSIFHLDQEGLHGLFHRVNPANLERINFDDPVQWKLVRNGLQVADYSAMELFSEGLRGGGLVSKVPVLGEIQNRFNEFLFKDYIPRLKMTMALHAFERNVKRYPKLSPDVVAELTARQGNAAFGELNYKLMGRNPTLQDFLRLTVLAPDFLEARGRFVGQALKPYGREQQAALFLGAATMYVAARALNQWLDNDPHWGKPFSVIYNGREYRLRTVMGDAAEVFMDPRRFFYNRFSPWLKTGWTAGSKRDYRGVKLNNWEVVKDALSWLVPIPLGKMEGATLPQRILGSAGVSNKPSESAVDTVFRAAREFKNELAKTDPKIAAEVKRAEQETYAQSDYARLNQAIIDRDNERATARIVDLLNSGKPPATIVKYFSNLPTTPYTGSAALEGQFLARMTAPERAQYASARNQRINMSRTFFQLFPNALRQSRR